MINNRNLIATYGLKWNPFNCDMPIEAIFCTSQLEFFLSRIEDLVADGGTAMICGDPGLGKSTALRLLHQRLSGLRDVTVANLCRPQSGLSDFYRELSELFNVDMRINNRWRGFKSLRERWKAHIEVSLLRPVLLIDEAQEMLPVVLSELRMIASDNFDSQRLLTVVLSGDQRLANKLDCPDLLPLESRIKSRLNLDRFDQDILKRMLDHAVEKAGNRQLITKGLRDILAEHAKGNPRSMMHMADDLLSFAAAQDVSQLDEKLFFQLVDQKLTNRNAGKIKERA